MTEKTATVLHHRNPHIKLTLTHTLTLTHNCAYTLNHTLADTLGHIYIFTVTHTLKIMLNV